MSELEKNIQNLFGEVHKLNDLLKSAKKGKLDLEVQNTQITKELKAGNALMQKLE